MSVNLATKRSAEETPLAAEEHYKSNRSTPSGFCNFRAGSADTCPQLYISQYHFTYTPKMTLSHARERAQDARRFHNPSPANGVFTTRNAAMTFTRSRLWRTLHRATGFSCSGRRPATMKRARKNVSKAALMWAARKL